jgi:uncharacterized membrane protein YccC
MTTAIINETARRDFFTCLGIWLSLEVLVFAVLPLVGLAQLSGGLMLWFVASLALGIVGAWLLSWGALMLLKSRPTGDRSRRVSQALLGQLLSWFGLMGIAFPLLVMSIEIFTNVFTTLTR